jgi:hypothetical protein
MLYWICWMTIDGPVRPDGSFPTSRMFEWAPVMTTADGW